MTAPGGDLLAWLENAISVREAAATAAAAPHGGNWVQGFPEQHKDPDMHYGWDADMVHLSQDNPHMAYQCLSDEIAALTVLHDPESVLRRCAADRKLIYEVRRTAFNAKAYPWDPMYGPYADAMLAAAKVVAEGYGWTGGER